MDEPVIELDAEQAALRRRDADWVRKCIAGDQQAFGQLYDAWFDRVFDLVNRVVRDRDVAAEVSQEAFFSAWRNIGTLEKPDAFGGWLLRIARNGAYNRNQKEQRSYAVDDQGLSVIESVGASPAGAPSGFGVEDRLGRAVTPGAAVEDAEIVSLVWQAAEALPERDLEVLDLQLRHGLTPAEIGDVMGMNRNAANQLVHRLKNRLETAIRARVLWRGGSPACEVLAQRLRDLGIVRFSADAVRVTERHVPGCVECDERQRLNLEPAALFAAVPLFVVPLTIKQAAAAALATAGVPMGGSAFLAAAGLAGHAAGVAGAGHAAANLGSSVGGAVNPTIGANVGHAISAPGATNVSIGGNVGHAIAPANPASTLGAQAGSSVGGALPGGEPAPGLGSAAGQSLASPTPLTSAADLAGDAAHVGDAAKVAGDAAGADQAAQSAAKFVTPPPGGGGSGPMPIPPPPPPSNTPRILMLAGAAAAFLILLLLGGLWWGGRGDDPELFASGPPPTALGTATSSTSTTTGPGTTSTDPTTTDTSTDSTAPGDPTTTTGGTPTTKGGTPTTTKGGTPTTQSTTPTTQTTPTTTRTTTSTTQPTTTTTTTPPPVITSSITNNPKLAANWYTTGPNATTPANAAPVLSWSVNPAAGFTVQVTGPSESRFAAGNPTPTVVPFTFSTASGSTILCPGSSSPFGSGRYCGVNNGSYNYVITVKNGSGQVVATKTETFVVNAPIIS